MVADVRVIPDMDFGYYCAVPALNWSTLKHMDKSPAHCRAAELGALDTEQSPAQRQGTLVHVVMSKPTCWRDLYMVTERVPLRSNAAKAEHKALLAEAESNGQTLVYQDEVETAESIGHALMANPQVASLVQAEGCQHEVGIFWTDEETGVECKALLDVVSAGFGVTLADWKTMSGLVPHDLGRQIDNWMYHGQFGWYWEGAEACGLEPDAFRIIAVETNAPYSVVAPRIGEVTMRAGRKWCRRLLRRYAECKANGKWPGYAQGDWEVDVPNYAIQREGVML